MRYRYFLFDWDGTMHHTIPAWEAATIRILQARGINTENPAIARHVIHNLSVGLPTVGVTDVEACIEQICATAEIQSLHMRPLHENVHEVLAAITARGVTAAVVSNNFVASVQRSLDYAGVSRYFGAVAGGDEVANRKPDPEILHLALHRLEADTAHDEAIMIGDSAADMGAAAAAGITSVYHYPAAHERYIDYDQVRELRPDHIIRELGELLEIV